MKSWRKNMVTLGLISVMGTLLCSAAPSTNNSNTFSNNANQKNSNKPLKIGVVSFKKCIEESKIGKSEQAAFESLKKQMESVLAEKEKTLNDMASKFNDADYLDSLSPEAETDLKRKFRALNQELSQQQNQYLQTLQQTNLKVVQKLQEQVVKAAESLAKNDNLDLIINDEACFYISPDLDLSKKMIGMLDQDFDKNPPQSNNTTLPGIGNKP
jgi:outer membrane protein